MASTLLPSPDEAPSQAPIAAPLADAYRAVLEGLELLAAKTTPLPRHSALAALRVLWNGGSATEWDVAVIRALSGELPVGDVLLAANGIASDATTDDAALLIAVDTLCGDGSPGEVRARVMARLGAPARAALHTLSADGETHAVAVTNGAPSHGTADDGAGWLRSCLFEASVALARG